jgi:hypothetical protein
MQHGLRGDVRQSLTPPLSFAGFLSLLAGVQRKILRLASADAPTALVTERGCAECAAHGKRTPGTAWNRIDINLSDIATLPTLLPTSRA